MKGIATFINEELQKLFPLLFGRRSIQKLIKLAPMNLYFKGLLIGFHHIIQKKILVEFIKNEEQNWKDSCHYNKTNG